MIFPKAKKIAKELDWYKTKNAVFGLYKGYFFNVGDASLLNNPQFKYITATIDVLSETQKTQLITELNANKKALKFTTFEIEEGYIFFQFIETFTYTKIKTLYALFDFLIDLFKKLNIAEQNKCHQCGKQNTLKFLNQNESGIILCSACLLLTETNYETIEREKYLEDKNYLTGFLGAIVFSAPGIIAWVLVAVYLERLASAMAFIIAFLGLFGYRYFKGRHGKLTKYVIVLANIASILIANVATIIALLIKEGLTLNQSLIELQANKAIRDMFIDNTAISFILAFFVWVWLLFFLKDEKLTIKLADKFEK